MADATGSDGTVYVLNAGTTHNQYDSVCRIVDLNDNLHRLCNVIQKQNTQAYFPSWVTNKNRVLI